MNDYIRNLKGSPARDAFKYWHKNSKNGSRGWAVAIDIDLALINSKTKSISAIFDIKKGKDSITNTEKIAYTELKNKGIPIYIVRVCADWENWKNICSSCGRVEYTIKEEEIKYLTIKGYKCEYVKVNGRSRLSIDDYWEVERLLRGYKNTQKEIVIENI